MKKQRIKITSKLLTGLVLLTGITSLPTNAVEVKTAAVDVNKASVKAKVYELNGHYYTKLVADKEVANVVVRITTETKAEFVLKKELIRAGEEVVVELDMTAKAPTRKLPHTGVKKEGFTTVNKVGKHTFNIDVRYEIATDEVKAKQEEKKKVDNPPATETKKIETPAASATNEQPKGNEAETKPEQPAATTASAENTKPVEAPKAVETTVAGTDRSAVATSAKEDAKAKEAAAKAQAEKDAEAKVQAEKEAKAKQEAEEKAQAERDAAAKAQAEKAKQQTTAPAIAGTKEEQIKQAFIAKVAKLRQVNGYLGLTSNAALNTAAQNRSSDVPNRGIDANIHGPNGSLQYEINAVRQSGYTKPFSVNIAITGNWGSTDDVAQRLFDILFKEIGNVVPAYPYAHRNHLLDATATEVGVGVTIKNGQVYLVQYQSTAGGGYNAQIAKPGKYLDGSTAIYSNGKIVG